MERNSEESKPSSIPYEINFEEQKQDARAALRLCSFSFKKLDHQTDEELEVIKAPNLNVCQKKSAECGTGTGKAMKNENIEKYPETVKGIDDCILPKLPPVECLNGLIGICSRPFEKQLTSSDLKESQNRLLFNSSNAENLLRPLLNKEEDLVVGVPVIVYDSEGRKHPMKFKVWHGRVYVLIGSWIEFARNHGFEVQDLITIWMFRHSSTEKLCFVIISRRPQTIETLHGSRRTALPPPK